MLLTLMCAVTLDGKIARDEHHYVDWSSKEDKRLFFATTRRAGVLILGHNTYRTFPSPLPGRLHIVLTHDPSGKIDIPNHVEYTNASPQEIVAGLEARGYREAIIAGGSQVNTLFLKANLIDRLSLTIEPVVFGAGIDLFRQSETDTRWRLAQMERLNEQGSLLLLYERQMPGSDRPASR